MGSDEREGLPREARTRERSQPASPGRAAAWCAFLRAERALLGLTQAELARRAGVAPVTIRKYEGGERTPTRATVDRLLGALNVPHDRARAILRDLGFDAPDTIFPPETNPDYEFTVPQLRAFVEEVPWPQFGTNSVAEIVAANAAAQALWGIDFEQELRRRSRAQLNFLAILAEPHARQRIANWTEMMARMVSVLRAIPESAGLIDGSDSPFADVFTAFAQNDPSAISVLYALWERTAPAPAKVRWNYPVTWHEPGFDEIRFLGTVTTASEADALSFNDWIPVDAASFATLEQIVAARRDGLASPLSGGRRAGSTRGGGRGQGAARRA